MIENSLSMNNGNFPEVRRDPNLPCVVPPPPPPLQQQQPMPIDLLAQIAAVIAMTSGLFQLMANAQEDPVAWLESIRQRIINATGHKDKAFLQKVRTEIDKRLSEVAASEASKQ